MQTSTWRRSFITCSVVSSCIDISLFSVSIDIHTPTLYIKRDVVAYRITPTTYFYSWSSNLFDCLHCRKLLINIIESHLDLWKSYTLAKENFKCLAPFHQGDLTRLHEDYMEHQSAKKGIELVWVNFLWKGSWSPTSHNVEPKTRVIYPLKACDNCFRLRTRLDDPNKPLMLAFSNANLTWLLSQPYFTTPKGWYARLSHEQGKQRMVTFARNHQESIVKPLHIKLSSLIIKVMPRSIV